MIGSRKKKDTEATKDTAAINKPILVGFDVSQTKCTELPDLKEPVRGEVEKYQERLVDFIGA